VQRSVSGPDRPKRWVTPRAKAVQRLTATVQEMPARRRLREAPLWQCSALHAVLRGGSTSDRHRNATATAQDLDVWGKQRRCGWLQKRQKATAHRIITLEKHRQPGPRDHRGMQQGAARLFLSRMSDQPRTKSRARPPSLPIWKALGAPRWHKAQPHSLTVSGAAMPRSRRYGAHSQRRPRQNEERRVNAVALGCISPSITGKRSAMVGKTPSITPNFSADPARCTRRRLATIVVCNDGTRSARKPARFVWGEGW
jgi:hypothetical protein